MMKRRKLALSLGIVAALVVAVVGVIGGIYVYDHKIPNFNKETIVYVYPDTKQSEVLEFVKTNAEPKSCSSLDRMFSRLTEMKPGRYVVKPSHTSIYLVRMLANGWQEPLNLVLSGTVRTKARLAQKISAQMMADSLSIVTALEDEAFLQEFGFTPETVFAMFLPDSYQLYWTASVEEIFARFKNAYDKFWTADRVRKAENLKLSRLEVSTLASIVSGETLCEKEYPQIAGVYLNRLKKKMKLQADPTVCFCYNYELSRVLKCHLSIDSPYNTYKYAGLPPAPINIPPKECIDAVLNPAKHNYLYFCASSAFDGTHKFASSYAGHLINAREFQKALTKKQNSK